MKIIPEDILDYCNKNPNLYLAHGTTVDAIDSFLQDGLAINPDKLDYPTVTFWSSGIARNGEDRIIDYTWCEPHSVNGCTTNCCVIFEIPKEILNEIESSGKQITQKNIFEKICKQKVMTVLDCESTRNAFERISQQETFSDMNCDPLSMPLGHHPSFGPKYCPYGTEPNSPFIGFGVPPEYILTITDSNQVYYANNKIKNFISEREGLNIHFPTD